MNETSLEHNATSIPTSFCDWRIQVYNCALSQLWVSQVTISLITYFLLAISGTFIFFYRYKYMWKGLFVDHGNGIRPLPVDNLLLFWTIACYFRGLHSLLMVSNAYKTFWQREFIQEIGWTMLCYGGILYLVGIMYTIPVNFTRTGRPTLRLEKNESSNDSASREIYIPAPTTLNVILAIWCLYPTVTALPFAVLSGLAKDHDNQTAAARWTAAQYLSYVLFDSSFAFIGAYYGIHFMLILRNSMKNFSRQSGHFHQSNSGATRNALDRLKYTMTYIAVLPMISAPWWGVLGIFHNQIMDSVNGVSIFFSTMWHVGGAQPLIAVTQYILLKRVYQHYTGTLPATEEFGTTSDSFTDTRKSALSPSSSTFPVTMSSTVINQQDQNISFDMELSQDKSEGIPDWDMGIQKNGSAV